MTVTSSGGFPHDASKLWYTYFGDEGIKRSKSIYSWNPDGITDLSEKEKLRWSKVCEWLDNYFRRNPASQPGDGNLAILLHKLETDVGSTLVATVSNLPGMEYADLFWAVTWRVLRLNLRFLSMLVILSLVYGGIHLATWNFAFASKTEHLLWKIACIVIMATVPVGMLCVLVLDALTHERSHPSVRETDIMVLLWVILTGTFFFALSVPYALSRIYIVVESFISLRHVPIGVYAAVPWVQAIPHV